MPLVFSHSRPVELYWWEGMKQYGEDRISPPQVNQKSSASMSAFCGAFGVSELSFALPDPENQLLCSGSLPRQF